MPRIFISYGREDRDFVDWLRGSLQALGHQVWVDRDDIPGGVQTFDVIHQALDQSEVMLLVMSPHSHRSHIVSSEWYYFYCECRKKLVPILLEPLEPPDKINFMLASLQYIDFYREDQETALAALHNTLNSLYIEIEKSGAGAAPDIPPPTYGSFRDRPPPKGALSSRNAGLLGVHLDFPVDAYLYWHQRARRSLKILSTWTGVTGVDNYGSLLMDAINKGIDIQVLLLDPSSPIARQRSYDLHLGNGEQPVDEEEVPKNIRASIRQLASLYPELEGLRGRLELRLYNALPPFSAYIYDDKAFIGFFLHAAKMTDFPVLEIRLDSPFGAHVSAEFERLWNTGSLVDLSPKFPAHIEAANQALIEPLSARELEIISLIGDGLSNQEIADRLVISLHTVKKHINHIYDKLGVDSRTRAIVRARELGLL